MSRPSSCLTSHPPGLELRARGFDAADAICGGLGSFLSYGLLNKFVLYASVILSYPMPSEHTDQEIMSRTGQE
jgi:hypothetical protein